MKTFCVILHASSKNVVLLFFYRLKKNAIFFRFSWGDPLKFQDFQRPQNWPRIMFKFLYFVLIIIKVTNLDYNIWLKFTNSEQINLLANIPQHCWDANFYKFYWIFLETWQEKFPKHSCGVNMKVVWIF